MTVDFKLVLEKILGSFTQQNIRYALMGGFAIGLWGGSRSTVDLDFLVHRDDMDIVHNIMTGLGYDRLHYTENVSQYASQFRLFGGIDFIHAFRDASVDMLQRAVQKDIFGGALRVRTLVPEDIIGLKLQAIYNNPSSKEADAADIAILKLTSGAEKELIEFAGSDAFRRDMDMLKRRWQNPFVKDGVVDIDGYLDFLTGFNEFINHEPKPFKPMIDRVMKL